MEDSSQDLAIGIDLGTTFCCVAVFKNGSAEVIPNDQGSRITPSTVAFTAMERLVGEAAQFQRLLDPGNVVYNAKRFIGRKFDDPVVMENKSKYPFKFLGKNNRINFEVSHLGKALSVSPEEVGAALLEKMKNTAFFFGLSWIEVISALTCGWVTPTLWRKCPSSTNVAALWSSLQISSGEICPGTLTLSFSCWSAGNLTRRV